jgi:CHAD domain-containing protein
MLAIMALVETANEHVVRPKRAQLSAEMPCAMAFRSVASACLESVAANHRGTCVGNPDALHQMRVALTRLRAAVALFSPMVRDSEWTRLKSELKWLNGHLGATRDLDVAIENAAGEPLLRKARNESQRRLRQALISERYRQWFKDMTDWVDHGPWSARSDGASVRLRASAASDYHARKLGRWHEKLVRKSRGLPGMGKHKQHRLRLASKRLRYAIEFSEDVLPKKDFAAWRARGKQLRRVQQILGQLNDAQTRRSLAARLQTPDTSAGQSRKRFRLFDRKKRGRLLRRAAMVYGKIAA